MHSSLLKIKSYTPPKLHSGKEWFISFYAFDPISSKLKRKRIKLNSIKSIRERRKYANDLMNRLSQQLSLGWNPWIEAESSSAYMEFKDVMDNYRIFIDKMLKDGNYRPETHTAYTSYCRNMEEFNNKALVPITYIYQFDKDFCVRLLEEVYIIRDNTPFTRDNYLGFLRSFASYCLNRNVLKTNPTEGISNLARRTKKKIRTTISNHDLERINTYVADKNKYYLLACYLLYYCFIRPTEMSKLRLSNFSIVKQTVFVPDTVSKNRKDGVITLPTKIIKLMVELGTFNNPSDYYLFSKDFKPGKEQRTEKPFRDFWSSRVRKDLKFDGKYKFYSLKDTGITNMLRHYDVLSVRDQARHSSILMTDVYTPHDIQQANELIKNYEGEF